MRRGVATIAVLVALAVSIGILLAPVPNVEGISAVSFFSGLLLGWARGGLVGGTAMLLLSLLNPLGPAPPPVLASQIAGMAVMGAAGCLLRSGQGFRTGFRVLAMAAGAVLTFCYDAVTNYGVAVSIGKWRDPLVVMFAGVPFAAIHVATNAMIFGAVAVLVANKRWAIGDRISRGSPPRP
ncbi:MAG TPA: ECF transporter S component [bacterium]|nr:ECF transporter S component [bacterium]